MMVNTGLCDSLCSKERLSIHVFTFHVPGRVPDPGWSLKRLLQNPAPAFPIVSAEVSSSTIVLVFHPLVSCMWFRVQRVPLFISGQLSICISLSPSQIPVPQAFPFDMFNTYE